jgi:hypothetical protein
MRSAQKQQEYVQLLSGKVPGRTQSCLPSYRSNQMVRIDENTLLFRDGANRVWVSHPRGGCPGLSSEQYTLVTRQFGNSGMCEGDIAQMVDLVSGSYAGSCVIGNFTPFERPRA